jgi:hypothetical protein
VVLTKMEVRKAKPREKAYKLGDHILSPYLSLSFASAEQNLKVLISLTSSKLSFSSSSRNAIYGGFPSIPSAEKLLRKLSG